MGNNLNKITSSSINSGNKSDECENHDLDELHVPTTPDPNSFKLQPAELNKTPDEVFDVISKVGEGSYGSVHKALHKESGHTLAIKMVPVDTDLQEIIKEITIMQQCDSRHVVKYYGSYFKNSDLWIVMEYCGAGSVSDIMRLRRKTLNECEIGAILKDTLQGLSYLHGLKKIHRDIKAGNILLNMDGNAKLADFGVAGQITDTMAKRNTVIGTPFWMAPELIQEMGYDMKADIWSLGITAIEMAEGRPPHAEIHPMRAIFMIPTKPPPTFKVPEDWSELFRDFTTKCLVKNPEERTASEQLLKHDFIRMAKGPRVVREMIANAQDIAAQYLLQEAHYAQAAQEIDYTTLISSSTNGSSVGNTDIGAFAGRVNIIGNGLDQQRVTTNTGISFDDGTLIQYGGGNALDGSIKNSEDQGTVDFKQHTMASVSTKMSKSETLTSVLPPPPAYGSVMSGNQEQQNLLDAMQAMRLAHKNTEAEESASSTWNGSSAVEAAFQQAINGVGDYNFLRDLSTEELLRHKEKLEKEMEAELQELRARYHAKRKAILDAIALKKRGTMQF